MTFDVMGEHQVKYLWTWRAVHWFNVFNIIFSALFLFTTSDYEIIDLQGKEVCVLLTGWVYLIATVWLALIDLAISLGCLYLLILPLTDILTGNLKASVLRNVYWTSLAIFTTAASFLGSMIMATQGYIVIGFSNTYGSWDILSNLVAINMCWKCRYYYRNLGPCLRSSQELRSMSDGKKITASCTNDKKVSALSGVSKVSALSRDKKNSGFNSVRSSGGATQSPCMPSPRQAECPLKSPYAIASV